MLSQKKPARVSHDCWVGWLVALLLFSPGAAALEEGPGVLESLLGLYVITAMIEEAGGVDGDMEMHAYVTRIWQRVKASSRRDGAAVVLILDSDDVNAFATPGGFFAVTRGLVKFIRSNDELACVLGHELGHFEYKHGLSALKHKLGFIVALSALDILLGDPATEEQSHKQQAIRYSAEIFAMLMELKFSRDNERDADFAGLMHTQKAAYNLFGCVDFMRRLARSEGEVNGIDLLLRTHPAAFERSNYLLETLSAFGYEFDNDERVFTRPDVNAYRWRGVPGAARGMQPLLSGEQTQRVKKGLEEMAAFEREAASLSDEQALNLFHQKTGLN